MTNELYLMYSQATGLTKIGYSYDVPGRLRRLQKGKGKTVGDGDSTITLLATATCQNRGIVARIERALHRQFRHYRKEGEWFALGPQQLDLVLGILNREKLNVKLCNEGLTKT